MQYAVEHKQVRDSISIALRQTRGQPTSQQESTCRNVEEPSTSSKFVQKGQGIHFSEEHTR